MWLRELRAASERRSELTAQSVVRRGLVVVMLAVGLSGCGTIYLHDPAGEAAAVAAKAQFQEAIGKGRLSDLVATYRAQNAEQASATRALQTDDLRNQIYAFSAKKWSSVLGDTATELKGTEEAIASAKADLKDIEKNLADSLQAQEAAAGRAADFVLALNRAADAERRHAATQKLLAAALQALFSRDGGGAAGQQALDAVLKTPVRGRSFREETGVLVETLDDKKTVGDVLGIRPGLLAAIEPGGDPKKTVEAVFKLAGGLEGFKGIGIGDPGIAVTIVGLGYDVARAEERRLTATIDQARRTRALYLTQLKFLNVQVTRLQRNLEGLKSLQPSVNDVARAGQNAEDVTVSEAIVGLRDRAVTATEKDKRATRNVLLTFYRQIGDNVQFRLVDAQARSDLSNAVEALKTERSLMIAEVNLREREAVILRGLDGLVAFHQGGIDADDVRNLIMLAQAFGVFAIAAK